MLMDKYSRDLVYEPKKAGRGTTRVDAPECWTTDVQPNRNQSGVHCMGEAGLVKDEREMQKTKNGRHGEWG